jgi:phosphinothricin acetyltransferase
VIVRAATAADLPAISDIHNAAVATSTAIWTDTPESLADREAWFAERTTAGYPVLVAEVDGVVAGFAAYSQWRARYGYRFSVENSVYLADEYQGRGIGRALMIELIALARAAGMHLMIADIEAGNTASIRLHESLGFVEQGMLREIGTKFDRWLDLAILVLPLDVRPVDDAAPRD